jgi:hypothetical protein
VIAIPRTMPATLAAAAAALACAGPAAGAVTASYAEGPGGGLAVTAPAGEANTVSVALECDGTCAFTVVEQLVVVATAGPGCSLTSVQPATIRCPVGAGPRTVRADLGDEDDRLTVSCAAPVRVVADLGPGNDRFRGCITGAGAPDDVAGGPGSDVIDGGPGDDVVDGGPGRDTLRGGRGADAVRARDGERDAVSCGTDAGSRGVDVVTVRAGLARVGSDRGTVDPADGIPGDCERVESARPGEVNGILPGVRGVARMNARGQVPVRLSCRRALCVGRTRADLVIPGRPPARIPGRIASRFSIPAPLGLPGLVALPVTDARTVRRGGARIHIARVAGFEPGRRGWRITMVTVPVRG